ncbi:hypothetical protein PGT21_006184 [Puccinia graminis f. sp. tritici]|uniref:Uncharacterized protein n=1 Tax=Puccinia graminis f. sp. tritici TaxID=56615 RepID=A0A5B0N4V6_PUCGR|nr:hypothetical protein PGT21_006184 [Puccinia graminis f. sp. tritici]
MDKPSFRNPFETVTKAWILRPENLEPSRSLGPGLARGTGKAFKSLRPLFPSNKQGYPSYFISLFTVFTSNQLDLLPSPTSNFHLHMLTLALQAPELILNLQDSVTLSKVFWRDIERPLKELRKPVRNTFRNVPGPRSRTSAPAGAYFETFPNELRKCFEPQHP